MESECLEDGVCVFILTDSLMQNEVFVGKEGILVHPLNVNKSSNGRTHQHEAQ